MNLPRRNIADWSPDLGVEESDWLQDLAAEGWVPEYGYGVDVTIDGRQVRRYAVIELTDGTRWPEPGIA